MTRKEKIASAGVALSLLLVAAASLSYRPYTSPVGEPRPSTGVGGYVSTTTAPISSFAEAETSTPTASPVDEAGPVIVGSASDTDIGAMIQGEAALGYRRASIDDTKISLDLFLDQTRAVHVAEVEVGRYVWPGAADVTVDGDVALVVGNSPGRIIEVSLVDGSARELPVSLGDWRNYLDSSGTIRLVYPYPDDILYVWCDNGGQCGIRRYDRHTHALTQVMSPVAMRRYEGIWIVSREGTTLRVASEAGDGGWHVARGYEVDTYTGRATLVGDYDTNELECRPDWGATCTPAQVEQNERATQWMAAYGLGRPESGEVAERCGALDFKEAWSSSGWSFAGCYSPGSNVGR